ncbi:MAG: hypothetical protein AAGD01_16160 [Acidobacteriota bacterium]
MSFRLGVHLNVLIGKVVPRPLPERYVRTMEQIQVTESTRGASGFQLRIGVNEPTLGSGFPILDESIFEPTSRVILTVLAGAVPQVLLDGIVTHRELQPAEGGPGAFLAVTGEDLSVLMDLEEKTVEHTAQNELIIANKIIATYARYGMIPKVIPPPQLDQPLPIERIPVQRGTDLAYLRQLAARFGYVFMVEPGVAPLSTFGYWGPQPRTAIPQPALSVAMASQTNVEALTFSTDALTAERVHGRIQDGKTNQANKIKISSETLKPRLAKKSALKAQGKLALDRLTVPGGGFTASQARARAQGRVNRASEAPVKAQGSLDTLAYGSVLRARGVVGVRGAGSAYDGSYYVESVTHDLRPGSYRQKFTLTREGQGSTLPLVRP